MSIVSAFVLYRGDIDYLANKSFLFIAAVWLRISAKK